MKELVTILLPTYNGQEYIRQMLDSIYKQDYRPLEIIITDDASTDYTVSLVNQWARSVDTFGLLFKFIRNGKNKGLSANISGAVKYIHGKYLFLADQDDVWRPNKVSMQVAYLEKNMDCIMCICDRNFINAKGEVVYPSAFQYTNAELKKRDYNKVMSLPAVYSANCICMRTEHLDKIFPIPRQVYSHDLFIAIMAAHYGNIGYIRRVLTQYRIHGNNLSRQYALETNRNLLKAGYIIYKGFQRKKKARENDDLIIRQTLEQRFHENNKHYLRMMGEKDVGCAFIETIRYIFKNLDRWKRFCK